MVSNKSRKGILHCLPILLASFLVTAASAQQSGSIRGLIIDDDFDVPLANAKVTIAETGETIEATEDGNYVLGELEPGTYTLIFSKSGYTRKVRADVVVSPGLLTEVNTSLTGDFTDMEEFVVQEIQFGGSAELQLLELRFEGPALIDSISSELISKAGASDAAQALNLVAGATVQDGKFAVVRGLPDRYVNSQLNGVRLPTADAEKKAVALDQFPAAAIDSLQVTKTFTPDQQGDASGGAVNIVLKGVPDEDFVSFSTSYSFNSDYSQDDDFLTYRGRRVDYFGYDEGTRDIEEQDIGGNWDGAVGSQRTSAPIDYSWSLGLGRRYELDNDYNLGVLTNFFYKQDSSSYRNGINDSLERDTETGEMVPTISQFQGDDDFITSLFDVDQSSQEIQWGALAVVGIEREGQKLTASYLYTHDSTDTVTVEEDTRGKEYYFPGYDPNDDESPGYNQRSAAPWLRQETLLYRERDTSTFILQGEHTLPDPYLEIDGVIELLPPKINWAIAESRASLYEPDKRQFGTKWQNAQFIPGFPPFIPPEDIPSRHVPLKPGASFFLGNLNRVTKEINEDSTQYKIDATFPFSQWTGTEGYLKFGFFNEEVERTYTQDSFTNRGDVESFYDGGFEDRWADVWEDETHPIVEADIDVDYFGEQEIDAMYIMADMPLTEWFSIIGGIRLEHTEIAITNFPEEDVTWIPPGSAVQVTLNPGDADVAFEQYDELPSLGFKFTPIEQLTIRGNYAQTVARQTFRELTPIQQQEFLGADIFIGNPELQMAALKNYDLRIDYTPYEGGLISASYFLKDIENPIENVQRLGFGFDFISPTNYPEGEISGFEFEVRQDMSKFAGFMEGLQLGANATIIESEVTLPDDEAASLARVNAEEKTRNATNAPEHLYNLYALYNFGKLGLPGTDAAVFYTVRGDTLVAGASALNSRYVPSVYETEFETLNAQITQNLGAGWKLKLQGKNLLNPEIDTVYRSDFIDGDVTKTSYKKGIEFSIGVSATF